MKNGTVITTSNSQSTPKNVKYISHPAVLNTHTRFNYSCKIKKALRSH